jgi:CubicO group peptidase (beta-lactamase class C family)
VALFAQQPLEFEPGSRWRYSNTGIAVLGRIIEVVSGQPYEKFQQERIFKLLGMKDSFFFPPADKLGRIAMVYRLEKGKLVRAGGDILGGDPALYRKGARLLSRASVEVMTALHTGALEPAAFTPGVGYGLAWTVVRDALGTLQRRRLPGPARGRRPGRIQRLQADGRGGDRGLTLASGAPPLW